MTISHVLDAEDFEMSPHVLSWAFRFHTQFASSVPLQFPRITHTTGGVTVGIPMQRCILALPALHTDSQTTKISEHTSRT